MLGRCHQKTLCKRTTNVVKKDVVLAQQAMGLVRLATEYRTFAITGDHCAYYDSIARTYNVLLDELQDATVKAVLQDKWDSLG